LCLLFIAKNSQITQTNLVGTWQPVKWIRMATLNNSGSSHSEPFVQIPTVKFTKLFINGEFVDSVSGSSYFPHLLPLSHCISACFIVRD